MSFTHVQGGGSANSASGTSVTLGSNPTAGNVVCVAVASNTSAALTGVAVKDGNNNSYIQTPNSPSTFLSSAGQIWLFYLIAPSNANKVITVTFATGAAGGIWVDEFGVSGGVVAFDKDVAGEASSGQSPVSLPSITPGAAGELLYSGMTVTGAVTAPAAGATLGNWTGAAFGLADNNGAEYNLSSSSGAQGTDYTQTGGTGASGMSMAFSIGSSIFEEDGDWWSGAQKNAAAIALAATIAISASGAAQAAQVFNYVQDDTAGLHGMCDEDYWQNKIAFQSSWRSVLYTSSGSASPAILSDEAWTNPIPPIPYYSPPITFRADDEIVPPPINIDLDVDQFCFTTNWPASWTTTLFGSSGSPAQPRTFDEDFWSNPVQPAPILFGRLYLPDPEEIPAGNLLPPFGQPDEDFWINPTPPVAAINWQPLPYLPDPENIGALSGTAFSLDEDYSQPIQIVPEAVQDLLIFLDDGSAVQAAQPDEDFNKDLFIYVAPIPFYPVPLQAFSYDDIIAQLPLSIDVDEFYWQNPVAPLWLQFGRLYLPDPEELPAGDLVPPGSANPIDEYWENPVAPVAAINYFNLPYVPDPEELPAGNFVPPALDENFWQNPVPPVQFTLGPLYLPDPEELSAGNLFPQPDEDFWINPVAPVPFMLGKLYLPDPEEIPAGNLSPATANPIDEYWQNPVPPTVASNWQRLPYLPDPEELPAGSFIAPPIQDEDFWSVYPTIADPIQDLLIFLDDGSSVQGFQPDEDFDSSKFIWVQPIAYYPAPLQAFTDTDTVEQPPTTIPIDETYWQTATFPAIGTFGALYLPDPEEIPAGNLVPPGSANPIDEYWQNQTPPIAASNFIELPYLPDPEEVPAGRFFGRPDEDFWINPVEPLIASEYQQLPYGSLLDPEEIPAATLRGQPDEDFWQNYVAPVPASNFVTLPYLPDPEELPAGSLGFVQDEDFWQNPVPPLFPNNFLFAFVEKDDLITFSMEEEFWDNYVPPIFFFAPPLVFSDDEIIPTPNPIQDEDFWQNPVPPIAFYVPPLVFRDDEIMVVPPPIQDEDFWQNPVAPVVASNYIPLPYLPDPEEIPAGSLIGFIPITAIGKGVVQRVTGIGQIERVTGSGEVNQ